MLRVSQQRIGKFRIPLGRVHHSESNAGQHFFRQSNLRLGPILAASIHSLLRGGAKIGPGTKSFTPVLLLPELLLCQSKPIAFLLCSRCGPHRRCLSSLR